MPLRHLKVSNYQSLESVEVDFGRLTVLVGPSNSGKSAILRAIRTLTRNAASPAFVTTGKKGAVVRLAVDGPSGDECEVILERGKGLSKYTLFGPGGQEQYPRSGTAVPDDIQDILRMRRVEDQDLNFAGQFDRPFLLDESSTQVAKVLGDLSNINIVYAAVREANRRRLEVTNLLKVRRTDEERLTEELREFKDLPARRDGLAAARADYDRLLDLDTERERLAAVITQVEEAERVHAANVAEMEQWPDVSDDLAALEEKIRTHAALADLVERLEADARKYRAAQDEQERLALEDEACGEEYREALVAAGTCPMCGQATGPGGHTEPLIKERT